MEPQGQPLATIYRTHWKPLRRKLVRHGVRFVDVDDVLHDLFSSLHRALTDRGATPRNMVAWVYASAYNEAVNYIRRDRVQLERFAPLDPEVPPVDAVSPSPDAADRLAQDERRRFLYGAIDRMSPEQRTVFEHRVLYGLTSEQTAEALDLPETTVLARYKAALDIIEAEYARWCARGSRYALVVPLVALALLLQQESERLDGDFVDVSAGGWGQPLGDATGPGSTSTRKKTTLVRAGIASEMPSTWAHRVGWSNQISHAPSFLGGGILGAVALWLFLQFSGLIIPPLHLRAEEMRWILSMTEPSASTPAPDAQSNRAPTVAPSSTLAPEVRPSAEHVPLSSVPVQSRSRRAGTVPFDEHGLIHSAQDAIGEGRFSVARDFLVQHARMFPNGELKSLRETLLAGLPQ